MRETTQVLVAGGGPAGTTAAALLSRQGFDCHGFTRAAGAFWSSSDRHDAEATFRCLVDASGAESDHPCTSGTFRGPGYDLTADAACFLDPLLSARVHLATYGRVLLAAAAICGALRGDVDEARVQRFRATAYRHVYERLFILAGAFYNIHDAQDDPAAALFSALHRPPDSPYAHGLGGHGTSHLLPLPAQPAQAAAGLNLPLDPQIGQRRTT
ncbi:hypothetical protein GCM10010521_00900 [Streptomyces rameus]|uniref:FAD-binding domain-containing protein n=1 Tax=Streptomyces rameus TaxID=68261 RepID=A0ABP6MJT6_9ACTN